MKFLTLCFTSSSKLSIHWVGADNKCYNWRLFIPFIAEAVTACLSCREEPLCWYLTRKYRDCYRGFKACWVQISGAVLEISLRVGVIPFNFTPLLLLLTIFVSSYSRWAQKPLQGALSAVFCAKLRLIHRVRLVWWDKITNFCKKIIFVQVKGCSRNHRNP